MSDESKRPAASLFADDPVDGETRLDRLERGKFVDHVVDLLDRVRHQSESSVLALIGPWGSGKSSLLAMTLRRLSDDLPANSGWLVAEFNPWTYADQDAMQAGFFAELRGAMPDGWHWDDARRRLGEFGKAVSPLGKIAGLVGLDFSDIATAASEVLRGDTSASKAKTEAEKALTKLGRPILMVVDDLDRLTPDELLRVFKLVRFVGRLPNVYYLLSYDETTLLDALGRTDLVGSSDESRARDYLEKIVQVRLDLPALRPRQASKVFDDVFEGVLARYEILLSEDDQYRLNEAYWNCLHAYLQTPRSIFRFLAQVDASYGLLQREVDFIDFVILTWIRTAEPRLYSMIRQHRAALTKTDLRRLFDVRRRSASDELAEWTMRVRGAGISEVRVQETLELLGMLFLPIREAAANITGDDSGLDAIGKRLGVGHADYFDRYFAFTVPDDDMPDTAIDEALRLIARDEQGPVRTRLTLALAEDTERMVRKLKARDLTVGALPERLSVIGAEIYPTLPPRAGIIGSDPRTRVEALTQQLLNTVPSDRIATVVAQMSDQGNEGLSLASDCVARRARSESASDSRVAEWLDAAQPVLIHALRSRLGSVASKRPSELADGEVDLVWSWWHLDQPGLAQWTRQQVSSGRWPLLDALARLVSTGMASGGGRAVRSLGSIDVHVIEAFYGLDAALDELADEIASVDLTRDTFITEPTWRNRQNAVLAVLRSERDRRADDSADASDTGEGSSPGDASADA